MVSLYLSSASHLPVRGSKAVRPNKGGAGRREMEKANASAKA